MAANPRPDQKMEPNQNTPPGEKPLPKTEAEWKKRLTPEQYRIMRRKGTERPFSGEHDKNARQGLYRCAGCGQPLFESETKFDAGCGWPSFFRPTDQKSVAVQRDRSLGMERVEVLCSRCQSHLGHVFPDGPRPTGLRYCINSAALDFEESSKQRPPDASDEPRQSTGR